MIGLDLHHYIRHDLGIGLEIHIHSQLLILSRNYNRILLFCNLELVIRFVFGFDLRLGFYL